MRVLITTPPGVGHVNPMVPLARSIGARGHEVRWATGPDACERVEQAGLAAVVAGLPGQAAMEEFFRRSPSASQLSAETLPEIMFPGMFGAVAAPAMFADLLTVTEQWSPDLVVSDAAELAGPIVAALAGVPNVTKSFGQLLKPTRVAAASEEVAPLWRSVGLEPRPYAGCYDHLYLDVYPPSLQVASVEHVPVRQALRPVPYDAGPSDGDEPALPGGDAGRPLVYVTMGTVFNDPAVLQDHVTALAALPIRLLVTVGPRGDPAALGDQPAHVRVERYVPQTRVLGHTDVVVSHAGSGTALAALALGLPQLCLPQGADQFANAAAVLRSGAGLALLPGEATRHAIAEAVGRLLAERSFRDAAAGVAGSIASMPGPDEVAARLEQLG